MLWFDDKRAIINSECYKLKLRLKKIRYIYIYPKNAVKMINIQNITLIFKFQQYMHYIWKEKELQF